MSENRYFQWIAGDKKGEVLVFDKIEADGADVYITFKDESRINELLVAPLNQTDLTGKLMAEIDNPKNGWGFKEDYVGRTEEKWEKNADGENVCVEPFNPGKKVVKLLPPRPSAATKSNFGQISNTASVFQESVIEKPKVNITDPVYIMMAKSKKVDNDIEMAITISMPPKSLYNVAKESFDEGGTKFVEYIIENIDVKDIKEALKIAITTMYETPEPKFVSPGINIKES